MERLSFFSTQIGDIPADTKILDVGGNSGNLLHDLVEKDPNFKIKNYTCIDVDADALADGRTKFPEANWIHYNAYSQVYNKLGEEQLRYPFEANTFDYVFAYSVHSHTTYEQMLFDVSEQVRVLKPGGKCVTTVVDYSGVGWFLRKRVQEFGKSANLAEFNNIERFKYLIDHSEVCTSVIPREDMILFVAVYNLDWLVSELQANGFNAEVKIKDHILGHNQKGLIITKGN